MKRSIGRDGLREAVLEAVADFFLKSRSFNGIMLASMTETLGRAHNAAATEIAGAVAGLVSEGEVTLTFSTAFPNPHIKALPDLPVADQLERLRKEEPSGIGVYPTGAAVRGATDVSAYDDRPFAKRLLLGEPQLAPVFFDLHVLERYSSDPRYSYSFCDYNGSIAVRDQYYRSDQMPERDQTLLQTFGLGYDMDGNRVAVVYLRYLSQMSPEHQQVWLTHIRTDDCEVVPDYYQNMILGKWAGCLSIYQAILEERKVLNHLASNMGKPPLFRDAYDERPREFSLLLLPTRQRYLEFVHLLDKMLSENINRQFFAGDLPLEQELQRRDGSREIRQKGTVSLLDEWLRMTVRFPTEDPYRLIVEPLKEVRRIRQEKAHAVVQDAYDASYTHQQDDLVERVHHALEALCLVLSSSPRVKESGYVLPEWLRASEVKSY